MEFQVQPVSRKAELRDRIRSLEAEKTTLESEISVLKEKVEEKELELYTASLENEVGTLRVHKTLLEERAAISTPYNPYEESVSPSSLILSLENTPTEETATTSAGTEEIVQPISNDDSRRSE
jgi:hypothetical protein